jgi:hypothetical protein
MSITAHAAIGAAIGTFTPSPLLAAGLGFVSHVLIDLVPHYDPPLLEKKQPTINKVFLYFLLLVDFALGALILWYCTQYGTPSMFVGGLVSAAVDIDAFFLQKLKLIGIKIHDDKSNWHKQTTAVKGLFNQGIAF